MLNKNQLFLVKGGLKQFHTNNIQGKGDRIGCAKKIKIFDHLNPHIIFNERKLVLGLLNVKVTVKVTMKKFGNNVILFELLEDL